jgi:glycine cleavage system H lipoate-binding protein/uncharacterized CHY-type Zn-finger protein
MEGIAMAGKKNGGGRGTTGYGSTYRKGSKGDIGDPSQIRSVLGGQVWLVKPDKSAKTSNPCIWMQAGAVQFKDCNNFYDCTTCKYDLGMRKKVEGGKQTSWQDSMRSRPGLERVCRHTLTNRIGNRACAYDYECSKCDFDQFFEDIWTSKTKNVPHESQNIKGFEVPLGNYYHNGHTWVRIESGGYIRVGMDDFSHKLLGTADAYELPLMGKELSRDKIGWGMKRSDNEADVLSPIDGVIVDVNNSIRENPRLAAHEPYEEGWLFMIRTPDVKKTVKELMTDTDCFGWINSEVEKLEGMIEDVAGPLATDGGYLVEDIYGHLPDLGWDKLTKTFLRT